MGEEPALRLALIGYGLAGRVFHAPLIAATGGLEVTAVVTADPGRREAARRDLPGARLLERPEQVWAGRDEFDAAVVATPTGTHVSLALAAVAVGLPVVVDKPLAPSAAEARGLAAAAHVHGVTVVPFHNRRWDSDHLTLQRLMREGALGEVRRYESRFERWRPERSPGSWRDETPAEAGGGVLLDLGAHLADQALTLHGPATRVYAEVRSWRGGADDDVFVAVQHASGTVSHLWAGAVVAAPGPRLRVLGRRAAFVVRDLDGQEDALRSGCRPGEPGFGVEPPERWGRLGAGGASEPVPSEPGSWLRFYLGLERCLRGTDVAPVPVTEAIAGLEVLDAARESAASGRVVPLGG